MKYEMKFSTPSPIIPTAWAPLKRIQHATLAAVIKTMAQTEPLCAVKTY